MKRHGIALVISAPSGAGKTTLITRLREEFPHFGYSVSCTTREPRAGECDGKDYHFWTRARFEAQREAGYFAEWAEVHGNLYGTPLEPLRRMLEQGQDVLFDIDVQGARQLKESLREAVFIFILPPSMAELEKRLHGRGLDSEETITRRLRNACTELREAPWYDYLVVNDVVDAAYARLRAAYVAATLCPACHPELVRALEQGRLD